jgi:hypothetical protein
VAEDRPASDAHHRLRLRVRLRIQARTLASGRDDCFHDR